MLASTGSGARLRTKDGADATAWLPELVAELMGLPAGSTLDDEVCILDDVGRSDFESIHKRARRRGWFKGAEPTAYCAFALIVLRGQNLRARPIVQQKAALQTLLAPPPASRWYKQFPMRRHGCMNRR